MSATVTLPSSLRTRLAAIHRRLRLLRAVRGLGLLVVVLGLFAAAAVLADHWLDLPALARQMLFSLWLIVAAGLLLRGVVVPLCRRIDTEALAAVIEEKYPDLGERLTSAVELASNSADGHGSPVLIAMLLEETAARSAALDFRPAVPSRRAGVIVTLAALTGLLATAPALLWPQPSSNLGQRFFRPWDIPPVPSPYDIAVTSGDVIGARGRSVPLSARVTPSNGKIALPETVTLLVIDGGGKETRQAMPRAENGDFTLAYKLLDDVSYRIEAGAVVSDSYRVTAITPVELAAESPTITVTPPAYARAVKEEETFHGLVDLSPLQHSEVRFDFRFTRPAAAAYLEVSRDVYRFARNVNALPFGSRLTDNMVRHPLPLSADRQAASFTMPALKEGKYRLVLEAEHEVRTELAGGTIHVQPDQPPSVLRCAGKEELRTVLPYERIPLEIEAADDIAVAGVELEYRINEGKAVRQPLDLQGGNTPSAIARHVFELAGKVKEDDRFSYRFHINDNLPKEFKGPHVIVYPADHWLTMKIARRGAPLNEQEILAQRDEINRRLQAIREALLQEKQSVANVQQETRNQMSLSPEEIDSVQQVQRENQANQKALREAAQFAAATPALQAVAELTRNVADEEMHKSQQALEQAPRQPSPADRSRKFWKADEQLDSALKRLDELKKTNDRLAQERLDRAKLEMLADREKHLAEQTAELAAKHPVLDPKARELAEKIKREQAEAAQELERLAQQSEPLKQALQQVREEQARQLSERAQELAQAQRDLARAEAETERQRAADRLAELARKQRELAEQEAKLAQETSPSAPVARTTPLKPEETRQAAEALKQGNAPEALRHQDKAANDLDRLAQAFEQAVKVSADPKEAARQLEQAEKALRQRVQEETARKDSKPLNERLKPLEEEQKAIRRAAEQLSVPPSHAEANKLRQQIGERAAQAAAALQKQDAPGAQARMEETKNLLHRLSDVLPNLEQRRQQAHREVERLRRQQDEIARQAEQIKKDDPSAVQRQAEAARRQAEAAEALSKMDAPNQEERRDRTAEALNRALTDLLDGRHQDLPASQQEAKRQLERLDQALRGEKPADERARELAGKQRELTQKAAQTAVDATATPQQKQELQRQQQQLAEQARNLSAPEAPQRQREAAEAAQRASQAANAQPASAETRKHMEQAARKLDELARQLAGEESDAARAERLAQRQADAAAEAERQSGKPATPEAQRRQQEIAREAHEVRGGEEAQQEKQRAMEALKRAEHAPAKEQAQARRQAADALRELADRLAGRNDPAAKANHLAQQQRELAGEVAQMEPGQSSPQQAKEAAQRQTELARQLRQLNGKDALPQMVEARARMADAAVALQRAKAPADAKHAVARAAESAEKLAEQLGKVQAAKKPSESSGRSVSAKPAMASPRQMAKEMAAQQRQLAQATQKAANAQGGQAGKEATQKAMQDIARQQSELTRQASQLPADQAQRGLEQARTAMNKAEQALAQKDAARAQRKQNEAADALERLAQQLPDRRDAAPTVRQDQRDAGPTSLPSKAQSERARQLARQQRDLRDALQRAAQTARNERPVVTENPIGDLARQQADVARQAADLARNVGQEQGAKAAVSRQAEQVRQSAQQAARQMQAGALPQAQQAGQQTAEQLQQLAAQLARTPRRGDADAPDPLQQARQLQQQQKEINRRLQPLTEDARAQAAQQQAQQRQLQQEAGELGQQFQRLAQQTPTSPPTQSALQRAASNSQQAQQAMQQARQQAQQGASAAEKQSQERAAQALDQAARAASEAAQQSQQASAKAGSPKSGENSGAAKAGEAVAKAGKQMAAAQGQLNQGQPAQAQSSMQQAAQSLAQAASRMAANPHHPGQPAQPIGLGRQAGGLPDLSAYGVDKSAYAGKTWGELPGELRTKIVQDMKARYGEDYARMIKYYFEQIADTKKMTR
jgi:hypothetical protein